jgi:hypothetical protein
MGTRYPSPKTTCKDGPRILDSCPILSSVINGLLSKFLWEKLSCTRNRVCNRTVGFGFGSDGSDQFDFLKEIGSDRINLHVVFFQIFDKFRLD